MENMVRRNWSRAARFTFIVICAALFIGAFVSLLVDFIKNGHFGWSIIVLGAVVMSWLIVAPWFILRRYRVMGSWLAAVVSVPTFLCIVESLSTAKGWLLPLGLPAAAAGLTALGGILWLWYRSRLKVWYAASLTFFFITLLSLMECALARPFLLPDPYEAARYFVILGLAGISLFLALIALLVHGVKPFSPLAA